MKQSTAPLVITVERGIFIGARSPNRQLVAGVDFVLLDLAKHFECAKCHLWWPMEQAVIVDDKPLCPPCSLPPAVKSEKGDV